MPVHDRFDAEANLLIVTFEGTLGDEDLLQYVRHALERSEVPPGRNELIDLSRVEAGAEISSQVVRRVADRFNRADRAREGSRVAIIATTDVHYGLSRMYQAFRSEAPVDLRVFRTMDEARAWLGLPPE